MRKTKMQKGITLIGLIVTIVILIILAFVAITAIDNSDILIRANDASILYGEGVKNQTNTLLEHGNTIGDYYNKLYGNGTTTGTGIVNGEKVKLGDTIKYDSNKDGVKEDWILLTCTPSLIEIVSKNVMYDSTGKGLELGDSDVEKAKKSFNAAESSMLAFCKKVVTVTSNVRMINSNDISKMSNLDILKSNSSYWISKKIDWWASDGFGHELRIFTYNANGIEQVAVVAGGRRYV